MAFRESIDFVIDGEDVKAAVADRAARQNDENIRQLRSLFDAAVLGQAILARDVTVESAAAIGMPVWYNPSTDQYERSLAGATADSETAELVATQATQVWGLVVSKTNATLATLLIAGVARVDLSASVTGDPAAGPHYLSHTTAGKLTATRPPVSVVVLHAADTDADGLTLVRMGLGLSDPLDAHRHYRFELQAVPAGTHTPPSIGERHVITDPDDELEGWLPAGHASFAGAAPPGAAFGYNLAASALFDLWPPIPVEHAWLEWAKADTKEKLGQGVPTGSGQLVVIDRNGIWWMSDCYDDVPWPTDYDGSAPVSDSVSVIECPRLLYPRLVLWFTRPTFLGRDTAVLSLEADESSGLTVVCADDGTAAKTGRLRIGLDLSLRVASDDEAGGLAFKALDSDGAILRGPVVESITAGTDNVTIENVDGAVTISVDNELTGKEITVDTVRLDGAEEELYKGTLGLSLRAGYRASLRSRLSLPVGLTVPDGGRVKLRFWLLNRSSSDMPAELLSLSYRRLPALAPGDTPAALPLDAAEVDLAAIPADDVTATAADQYFALESEAFEVESGDTIHFTLTRDGDTDDWPGDLVLLRQFGLHVAPA